MLARIAARRAVPIMGRNTVSPVAVQARSFADFKCTRTKEDNIRLYKEAIARGDDPTVMHKPPDFDDNVKGQGYGWYMLIGLAIATFVIGPLYDTSRPTQIRLKVFGTNAPL